MQEERTNESTRHGQAAEGSAIHSPVRLVNGLISGKMWRERKWEECKRRKEGRGKVLGWVSWVYGGRSKEGDDAATTLEGKSVPVRKKDEVYQGCDSYRMC